MSDSDDLPNWANHPIRSGLQKLFFVLTNFEFFGHDSAISALVELIGKTTATIRALSDEVASGSSSESAAKQKLRAVPDCNAIGHGSSEAERHAQKKFALGAVVAVIVMCASLFTAPSEISQALITYKDWIIELREQAKPLLPNSPLMIEDLKGGTKKA